MEAKYTKNEKSGSALKLIFRFAIIVASMVVSFTALAVVGVFVYGVTRDDTKVIDDSIKNLDIQVDLDSMEKKADENKPPLKLITNVAVFGVDDEGLHTDVTFVASFNSETKEINILSVPRDSKVTMSDKIISGLKERNREGFIPTRNGYGVCKFTEVHAYAGDGYRNDYSVLMLEDMLGIDIDYYVRFTTDGFISAIDAMDGVDFYVPQDMYWDMRDEGGPLINLKEGMQHLDGEKAEQLVRFRKGYASQDLKRIEVQQDFMRALLSKMTSMENIKENIVPLTKTLFNCVETDASIMDALKYVKYINDIDTDNIRMETIPGEGTTSYFIYDEEGTKEIVQEMIYGKTKENAEDIEIYEENDNLEKNISENTKSWESQ